MPMERRTVQKAPQRAVMDRPTFQRLWRVMMKVGADYNAGKLPREWYEDVQKIIVWMDNARNSSR